MPEYKDITAILVMMKMIKTVITMMLFTLRHEKQMTMTVRFNIFSEIMYFHVYAEHINNTSTFI